MSKTRSRKEGVKSTDVIKLRGCLQMQLHNALVGDPNYGKAIGDKVVIDNIPIFMNTVVTSGRRWVLSRIYTNDANTISHLAVGTGTTAPATGNTALGNETTRLAVGTFTTTGLDVNPPSWRAETTFKWQRLLRHIKNLVVKFFLIDSESVIDNEAEFSFC
jgi:hypothetical protein